MKVIDARKLNAKEINDLMHKKLLTRQCYLPEYKRALPKCLGHLLPLPR